MKSKEQKRAEAIERARDSYASNPYHRRKYTEEEYLDLFRPRHQRQEPRTGTLVIDQEEYLDLVEPWS